MPRRTAWNPLLSRPSRRRTPGGEGADGYRADRRGLLSVTGCGNLRMLLLRVDARTPLLWHTQAMVAEIVSMRR